MARITCLLSAAFLAACVSAVAQEYFVYVGTYTRGESKGIYAWRFNPATGDLKEVGLAGEAESPSFIAVHPNGRFLYAVGEGKEGKLTAFALDAGSGKLTRLNSASVRGSGPCYVWVDKAGRTAMVANYSSGNVAAVRILPDGKLGESTAFHQHEGKGANPKRQQGPFAHSIKLTSDERFAISADLGTDELVIYKFDKATGSLTPHGAGKTAPGAGPRHFAFGPNEDYVYSINELNSTITPFRFDRKAGKLEALQAVPTVPVDFKGENYTAEIVLHPNGRFLYGSNRGHDSIAVFRVEGAKLTPIEHVSTQGKTPRNFAIDPTGKYLFAANQASGNIVVFRVDGSTGKLTPAGRELKAPFPVCIRFARAR